jgi:4-hydroxythreonine-4-phosphate dehydrogenase
MRALGITLGDITGIGPEVALKALAREVVADEDTRYVLIGDHAVVRELCGLLGVEADLPRWGERAAVASRVYVHDPEAAPLPRDLAPGAPVASLAAVRWLREGARLCLAGELVGLVTAPVSKEAIIRAGQPFIGQTEFLGELAGEKRTAMMLLGHDDRGRWLRVALATTHLPLKDIAVALTVEGIAQTIELAAEACARLGLARRRVAVCGLNPHAGEGGKVGHEELDIIAPAVALAKARGVDCHGPSAADTLFHRVFRGDFDAVVAMYHDQGLVPLKMVAFDSGVNWTLGLPFVRTSPDHGTAYDLAGRGEADPSSMAAAIRLARELAR